MYKIIIAEDQIMMRDTLVYFINTQDDMEVAGVTDDAAEAPELCRKLKPDLVLMDVVTKNDSNGITYAALIRKELPEIKIVIMTGYPEITFVDQARKAGLHSFINKHRDDEYLLYVIRSTMQGHGIYPGPEEMSPLAANLTEREIAIVRLICQGKPRTEIINTLAISEPLMKKIISAILEKTGFDTIQKFASYAGSRGLIVP